MAKLNTEQIKEQLQNLQFNWKVIGGHLEISMELSDFKEGVWTIQQIGNVAEELNHHPNLELINYNQLKISITTHSAGALTDKDFALAERIDAIITRINSKNS